MGDVRPLAKPCWNFASCTLEGEELLRRVTFFCAGFRVGSFIDMKNESIFGSRVGTQEGVSQ